MTNTTYYNLNIVEGTDIVNPLTVDNPNYAKIDETMHNNAVAGVTLATEIANATVHAITRENSDCSVIRFIATSRWKAGDTATVDGVPVTALLPNGKTLPDGAYVINSNVLCILTGTNLTMYLGENKVYTANDIQYNDTTVGEELTTIGEEITNINSNLKVLESTIPSTLSGFVLLDYPAEFNYNNTMIIGIMYKASDNNWYDLNTTSNNYIYVYLGLNNIGVYVKEVNNEYVNRPIKIAIMKYN